MTREEALERIHHPHPPPLDDVEQRSFDDWLERDETLRELHREQCALFAAMDAWEDGPEPSDAFEQGLRARLEGERSRPTLGEAIASWLRWPRAAWACGAAALLAAMLVSVAPERLEEMPKVAKAEAAADSGDDAEFLRDLDRALDDMEMLMEFDALAAPPAGGDRI